MKFILTSVILWICFSQVNSQTLTTSHIGGAGSFLTSSQGSLHFNLGEVSIQQHAQLREGLIQFYGVTSLVHRPRIELDVNIFPNPTPGLLNLNTNDRLVKKWAITDVRGMVIQRVLHDFENTSVDLSRFVNGAYYAVALADYGPIQAFPFQIMK